MLKTSKKVTKKVIVPSKNEQKQAKYCRFWVILTRKSMFFRSKITLFDYKKTLFRVKSVPNVPLVSPVSWYSTVISIPLEL
jgi:hypothetical protein